MATAAERVEVRLDRDLGRWVTDRVRRYGARSPGSQIHRDLALLRALLDVESRRLTLTVGEATFLAHVVDLDDHTLSRRVDDQAASAIRHQAGNPNTTFAEEYGFDEDGLLDRLNALGPTADIAVRDALKHWWHTHADTGPAVDDATTFRAVGLNIAPTDDVETR